MWILPWQRGLEPGYEQLPVADAEARGGLHLVASPDAEGGALLVNRDARLYLTRLGAGEEVAHALAPGRHAWVHVARGDLSLAGLRLAAGDGAAVSEESRVVLRAGAPVEALLFDLG